MDPNDFHEPLLPKDKKREILPFIEVLLAQGYTPKGIYGSFKGSPEQKRRYAFEKSKETTGHENRSLSRKGRRTLQQRYKRLFKKNPKLRPKK